jgi:MerR family mercuric resistance operon transcriptional regulator
MSYTIGTLAAAAGVHVETIRYYERRGLIVQPERTGPGYRRYGDDDLWRLRFIARGKLLGFTLADIGELLGAGSVPAVLAAARARIDAVDEQRRELDRQRCRLEQLADLCRQGADADCVALRLAADATG